MVGLLLALSACSKDEPAVVDAADVPAATPAGPVAPTPAAATPAGASASLDLLKAYLGAWNEHDSQKAGSFLADDVQYFDASFAGMQRGRQAAVEQGIDVFLRGVPDLHWEIRNEPVVSADGVAFEWTFTGTHTGTWGGVRATNQKINLKGIGIVRIKNGKIVYHASYYDGSTLNKQMGL
jgi:steroid delta-isomerase-like uncharacterized protein